KAGEDPSDWVLEFKRFVIASRINVIAGAGGVAGLTGINANQFLGEVLVIRNNAEGDNTIISANIIPVGTWDKDWSIAGGHPAPIGTPSPANYTNAGAVEAQKNLLFFGQIVQGGLNPMNQYNVRMMAKYHNTKDNITKALVEAEKFSLLQGNFLFPPSGGQENQITLSQVNFKKIIASLKGTIAKGQQTLKKPPGPGKQKADDLVINHFLDNVINNTDLLEEAYNYDPIEDLRKQFEDLDINQAKLA
ncbi:4466_t:CDS:2, partial [Acaulospora morrowiae]